MVKVIIEDIEWHCKYINDRFNELNIRNHLQHLPLLQELRKKTDFCDFLIKNKCKLDKLSETSLISILWLVINFHNSVECANLIDHDNLSFIDKSDGKLRELFYEQLDILVNDIEKQIKIIEKL